MTMPKVSIVVPNYNRATLIGATVQSVLDQSYKNWELLIVDDGSTDDSESVVGEYFRLDQRIRFFKRSSELRGAPVCRNIGMEKAQGEFLIFLDSDDILAPYCLEQRVNAFLKKTSLDFMVFPMLIFQITPGESGLLWSNYKGDDALSEFLSLRTPWQTTGPIWKTASIKKIGGWDETVVTWQDWEFHIRALLEGLSYKIEGDALPDCFLRRNDQERISARDMNLDRVQSKLVLFEKIMTLLQKKGFLTPAARISFARLLFQHGERVAIKWPNSNLPREYIKKLRDWKLVPVFKYKLAMVYISALLITKKRNFSLCTSALYKLAHYLFPSSLVLKNQKKLPELSDITLKRVQQHLKGIKHE